MLLVPEPQGGRSTVTTTLPEVLGHRSAVPEAAGKVVRSRMRNRSRVRGLPVLFVNVRRMSTVPNVEFCAGTDVGSRTKLGEEESVAHVSSAVFVMEAPSETGEDRSGGRGATRRCAAPVLVPFVSTKTKSAAL